MNEFVGLAGEPALMRNSLILIGLTFRTFSAVVSDCVLPFAFVHEALPTRSPLKAAGPEVTLKVALTLAPGATGSANVFDVSVAPETTEVHPAGTEMLNLTPVTGAPVVFVNVTVVSCEDPGENVWSPGGVAVADAGARLSRGTSYLAATTLACTFWLVSCVGKVPGGRHRAFIEGALRADAVVAAVAQEDGSLLAHRVIGGVDARSVEHDLQVALSARRRPWISSGAVRRRPWRSRIAR